MAQDNAANVQNNITYSTDTSALSSTDLIIEAIIENIDLKNRICYAYLIQYSYPIN